MKPFDRRRFLTMTLQAMALAPFVGIRPVFAEDTFRPLRTVAAQQGLIPPYSIPIRRIGTSWPGKQASWYRKTP